MVLTSVPLLRSSVITACLAAGFVATPAAAAGTGLGLRWNDPDSLAPLSADELNQQLSAKLGHPAFADESGEQELVVTWEGTAQQCAVVLTLTGGPEALGPRRLESPHGNCRSLSAALLTVAALLIEARPEVPEPPPEPPPPKPTPSRRPRVVLPAPPRPTPPHEPQWLLSAGGQMSSGFGPRVELGPAIGAAITPLPRLRAGVRGTFSLPQQIGPGPGMRLQHSSATALLCGMPVAGSLALGACATVTFHHYRAQGVDLAQSRTSGTSVWTTGVDARFEWRLAGRLWWVAHGGADVSPVPLYFHFTTASGEQQGVFEQRRVASLFFLGLSAELP